MGIVRVACWAARVASEPAARMMSTLTPTEHWNGRRDAPRLAGRPCDTLSCYIEVAVNGCLIGCLYLPNGNPGAVTKIRFQAALVRAAHWACRRVAGDGYGRDHAGVGFSGLPDNRSRDSRRLQVGDHRDKAPAGQTTRSIKKGRIPMR
jgi:hypothetical protein